MYSQPVAHLTIENSHSDHICFVTRYLMKNLRLDVSDNLLDAELASVVQGVTRMRSLLRCSLW